MSKIARFRQQAKRVKAGKLDRFSLIIDDEILQHVLKKMNPRMLDDIAEEYSNLVLSRIGMHGWCADTIMDKVDKVRAAFNNLYDAGILRLERQDILVYIFDEQQKPTSRLWRLNYWMWNYSKIIELVLRKKEDSKEKKEQLEMELYESTYANMPDELWKHVES